ncbi:putative membrane protein [Proteiniphilum saccharofermentans]|jgi:hypothetical protein|uniref:Putative membrane protein n=1 Tax=Proteiniphilum saccharofermentans TaxID=1642647 RepID=A0A1R3T651_9BACT|nr:MULTISPECIES: hypothetical protein [Proteiniphilum]MDY9919482.1 hypothetical protein [Proteiniphilum sp.]SCD21702.1 putative membrane protein [Proteiniphilum saccharofermentans]SEA03504.1 hypothetical protein SAMN05216331_11556 [Porphyromonadaceae bacterium KH3R12]SFS48436.1 hypothetical protein SAMN05216365_10855 [Porphyromonadaceae bacterium NLAE-zl-C104]
MIKILILGFAILFIAILLMGIRVFFTKKGEFPSLHIGDSKPLQDKGIHCATSQDSEISRRESPIEKMLKSENI